MKRLVLAIGIGCSVCGCWSKKPEKQSETEAPKTEVKKQSVQLKGGAALGSYSRLPVPADFVESSRQRIDENNYVDRLDELERDYAVE